MSAIISKSAGRIFFLYVFVTFVVCQTVVAQSASQSPPVPLITADAAMRSGRYGEAAREYEEWLRNHPGAKEVLLALGICYVQLERPNEAAVMLRRYVKLVPDSAAGHAALGIALLDGAKNGEAKTELETAVRLNPKQTDAVEALARVYLIEGQPGLAVFLLQPFIGPGATEEMQALLADALIKAGQPKAAAAMLERVILANPQTTPRIYTAAALAYLKSNEQAKAAEICEQGMRLYPDSEIESVYLSLPAPFLAERIGARIERLQNAPDAAELVAVGRVLIDADPARKTRANEIAQRLLIHAITLAPENASAHYNYGRALSQSSTERALVEWEKALSLNPINDLRLQILIKIGMAQRDLSNFEAAEQAYKAALDINRKLPQRRTEAALEYIRFLQLRSRIAEAEVLLGETLGWNPLSPQLHLERAKLRATSGQWDKVVEEGQFVLRNSGDDEELARLAHVLLARAYLHLNQADKAQQHKAWIESH